MITPWPASTAVIMMRLFEARQLQGVHIRHCIDIRMWLGQILCSTRDIMLCNINCNVYTGAWDSGKKR